VINKLKETLQSLNETSSKECSKILNDASQRIKADVKNSDAKQKVFAQQFIETKKTSGDQLKQNYEEEREKRKVLSMFVLIIFTY
jgi:predicted nucleic acid-binding Zn ribbon protein